MKHLILLFLALIISSNLTIQNNDEENYIIARYSFEEGSGIVINDVSGNNRNGEISGSVKWVDGRYGKALKLNSDTDSYIRLPDNLLSSVKGFTFTGWIYWNGLGEKNNLYDQRIIDFHAMEKATTGNQNDNRLFWLTPAGGGESNLLHFENYSDRNGTAAMDANNMLPVEKWTHVAWVINPVTQSSSAYINGELVASKTGWQHTADKLNLKNYFIGKSAWGAHPSLNASIDEFVFFNKALSPEQIKLVMNNKTPFSGSEFEDKSSVQSGISSETSSLSISTDDYNKDNTPSDTLMSVSEALETEGISVPAVISIIIATIIVLSLSIYLTVRKSRGK